MTVRLWLSLPLLFVVTAAGIAALLHFALSQNFVSFVTVSVPPLLGFASAVAVVSWNQVQWDARWQRRWLRYGYPLLLLSAALSMDWLRFPVPLGLGAGVAAGCVLAMVIAHSDTCGPQHGTS